MKTINQALDPETFRKQGHELINLLSDYLAKANTGEDLKVLSYRDPETSYEYWKNYKFENTEQFFAAVLAYSNHLHHPHYVGHQVSATIPISALSGLVVSFLKNASGVFEMAPVGLAAEKYVVEYFGKLIGYTNPDGFITSGGTLANLTALLTARQVKVARDIWNEGNEGNENNPQLAVMVSGESHYCIDRAVRIMGLGAAGMVKIPINKNFQTDTTKLEETYQKALANGKQIFAIVGNACNTATGTFDDLEALAQFAAAKNIWFHVDGAHGGAAIFSEKYKPLLAGIEIADSVIIDSHKMLMTAGLCTAVVYKNGQDSYKTFQLKAQYLFDDANEQEWYTMTKRTFECTKFMNALNTFIILKQYGQSLFKDIIEKTFDLGKAFAKELNQHPNFEIPHKPQCNIVCFRYYNPKFDLQKLNEINKTIRTQLVQTGDFFIVNTTIKDTYYLRVSLMNPLTNLKHLEALLEEIIGRASYLK